VSLNERRGKTHADRILVSWSALDQLTSFDKTGAKLSLLYIAGLQLLNFEENDPIAANETLALPEYGRGSAK